MEASLERKLWKTELSAYYVWWVNGWVVIDLGVCLESCKYWLLDVSSYPIALLSFFASFVM